MEDQLRGKIQELGLTYIEIPAESVELICQLFCHDVIGLPQTAIEYFYFGSYYYAVRFNQDLLLYHYTRAMKMGNDDATSNLGYYYLHEGENSLLGKQCCIQALDRGNVLGAVYLVDYYRSKAKPDLKLSFLKKSAQLGDSIGIRDVSRHYLDKPSKLKYFLFGLTHQQTNLITRHYLPERDHYLLQTPSGCLPDNLKAVKQTYLTNLFLHYQQTDTWFKHSCVKDVQNMVYKYLNC